MKHVWLYTDLLQALKGERLSTVFSPDGTLISASAAPHCGTELYNHKANENPSVLNCAQTDIEDDHPILRKEVEAAVQSLKKGKSAEVDNVPAELIQAGGEDVITALTTICSEIRQT